MSTPSHSHALLTSSENPNWRTPGWLFTALCQEFDFLIDCAADAGTYKVDPWLGPGSVLLDDARLVPWADIALTLVGGPGHLQRRALFVNPPYCRGNSKAGIPGIPIEPWVKMAAEAGESITTVAILPYATQTEWWGQFVYGPLYRAKEIRRFPYRISFDPPIGSGKPKLNANVNTAVVVWSPTMRQAREPWVPHEWYWDVRP